MKQMHRHILMNIHRMAMNLIKANVQRNSEKIDEVIEDLTNIRWGFQKAIEIQSGITTVEEVIKENGDLEDIIGAAADTNGSANVADSEGENAE